MSERERKMDPFKVAFNFPPVDQGTDEAAKFPPSLYRPSFYQNVGSEKEKELFQRGA